MTKGHEPPEVLPLPELPPSQQGTSTASTDSYKASVSNAAGYLCHIQLQCRVDVAPEVVFEIFSHPDNAGAFRDIKKVGYRKVVESSPGFKRVEVEQVGELHVMWVRRTFRTYLDVTEDQRDPECLKTDFTLLRSDILSRFHGAWQLRPVRDAAGQVVGCDAQLEQDVLPRGVPSFFARLPVLGGLLRQVSLGTIKRLVEDLLLIVNKYTAAGGKLSVGDVLVQVASERGHKTVLEENRPERLSSSEEDESAATGASSSSGHRGGRKHKQHSQDTTGSSGSSAKASNVTSFAVDDFSDSEDLSSDDGSVQQGRNSHDSSSVSIDSKPVAAAQAAETEATAGKEAGAAAAADPQQQKLDAVAGAAAAAAAAAAATGGAATPGAEPKHQHSHRHKHRHHSQQQARVVGVLLDVSQNGHVSVVVVPGDL